MHVETDVRQNLTCRLISQGEILHTQPQGGSQHVQGQFNSGSNAMNRHEQDSQTLQPKFAFNAREQCP